MTHIKINDTLYPARVLGYAKDPNWGGRESKRITLTMTHAEAEALFVDGARWGTVTKRGSYTDEDGEIHVLPDIELDLSDFDVAGAITDNRDGTVTVCMGRSTPAEVLGALTGTAGPMKLTQTRKLRAAIETAAESLDDATASTAPGLFRGMNYDGLLIIAGTRINWGGVVKRAAVDLWDRKDSSPDNAPELWEDLQYRDGYRIIPQTITVGLAFAQGEKGWWGDTLYTSRVDGNVYTPDEYAGNWEVAE